MKQKILLHLITFFLGGLVLYIFICFYGVVLSTNIHIDLNKLFYSKICLLIDSKEMRTYFFLGLGFIEIHIVLGFIIFIFTSFHANNMNSDVSFSALIFTLGAISLDNILNTFIHTEFNFSYFSFSYLTETFFLAIAFNFFSWLALTLVAIKIWSFIRNRTDKRHHPSFRRTRSPR